MKYIIYELSNNITMLLRSGVVTLPPNPFLKLIDPYTKLISSHNIKKVLWSFNNKKTQNISKSDLYEYFVYFFQAISCRPDFQTLQINPETFAKNTIEQCFSDLDSDDNENIDYNAILNWLIQ